MKKFIHKTWDKDYARRLMALLMLHEGKTVSALSRALHCSRFSVNRWINWFTLYGLEGLKSLPSGRPAIWNLAPLFLVCCRSYYSTPRSILAACVHVGVLS
ncbi:hypothetical protein XBJ1_2781 [Xenorhabdus bovienii SS-2004]|uniref:Uncharacterized protein n=1 Tax=Xenorhabdus bovienii (strain SS-2004) TaxID=406818 RepID=D3V7U3_XENBS|nr:hypothetical protein XBJ1_2781 [Xenorhabdus bovienii SS-2004]